VGSAFGEVIDPEDGLVWRWEKDIEAALHLTAAAPGDGKGIAH
jgi:hypothetical protein